MSTWFIKEGATGNGRTPYTPCSPLILSCFAPGDIVYLLGRVRQLTGIPDGLTIRGDYPDMPGDIFGAYNASAEVLWTEQSPNLWMCGKAFDGYARTPSWMMLGDVAQDNVSRQINKAKASEDDTSPSDMAEQGQCWFNRTSKQYVVYSVGNPALVYQQILIPEVDYGIWFNGNENINIYGLTASMCMSGGIRITESRHLEILDNKISYTGGATSHADHPRAGNGISTDGPCSNLRVLYNDVSQTYDLGISVQNYGNDPYTTSDIEFNHNKVDRCAGGISFAIHTDVEHVISDAEANHNRVTNSGYGWAGAEDNALYGIGLGCKETAAGRVSATYHHNIVSGCNWAAFRAFSGEVDARYNVFANTTAEFVGDNNTYPATVRVTGRSFEDGGVNADCRGVIKDNVIIDGNCPGVFSIHNQPDSLDMTDNLIYNHTVGLEARNSQYNFDYNDVYQCEGTGFVDGMEVGDNNNFIWIEGETR